MDPARLKKSVREIRTPTSRSFKKDICLYKASADKPGLVQPQDKIVDRYRSHDLSLFVRSQCDTTESYGNWPLPSSQPFLGMYH